LRVGERAASPEHGVDRVGVGVNRRVGLISVPAGDLDLIVCHFDPKAILEVLPPDSPLYELPNVVLTPHVAGALGGEVRRLGDSAIDEIARYAAGELFAHPVTVADLERVA
jgi:hypothetical protein